MSDATFHPGYKFSMGFCMKFDCVNREIKCKECHRLDNYKRKDGYKSPSKGSSSHSD
jgi:hypothetical protein